MLSLCVWAAAAGCATRKDAVVALIARNGGALRTGIAAWVAQRPRATETKSSPHLCCLGLWGGDPPQMGCSSVDGQVGRWATQAGNAEKNSFVVWCTGDALLIIRSGKG